MGWRDDLEQLTALVAPPMAPVASEGDFSEVEARWGTPLPADWKALVSIYGAGTFAEFFHFWSPFLGSPFLAKSLDATQLQLKSDRELRGDYPDAFPFTLFPKRGGALPWGNTDNGEVAYWLTSGPPDTWRVVVYQGRGRYLDRVPGNCASFLLSWLGGTRACSLFPEDLDFALSTEASAIFVPSPRPET